MGKIKVGVQLFSLRDYLKKPEDVPGVFQKVKSMGAEVVQISHMCDIDSVELGKISKDNELPICITHSSVERIKNDLPRLAEEHLNFNCKNMGIGMMPGEYRGSNDGIKKFIELLNIVSENLKPYGMTIAYHNHNFEFKKLGEKTIYDVMIEETQKEVQFIPDTFWIKVGGYDPNDYIKKLSGRINTLHLKDYSKIFGVPVFRAIGLGTLDFKDIMGEAEAANVENAVIELDLSPNPYKSIRKSLTYMKSIY
ncbi:MAG: Xylose isomerase-like TIM barrel [Firmicutes bacterium ADurb.Bin080]|jgi:sugar phosphate isomerase/epimerase|nr:sugar phosphate isomerase/epimerase [Clostridiales bacterium]OQC16320.1 MAG: Xylose isomerase-like TIM barrel [Firmicutes bacterium ADurb.Bin080]